MNYTYSDFVYNQSPSPTQKRIEGHINALHTAHEAWLGSCFQRFAPGIYALVKSGQLRAAAARIRAFNFHTRVYTFDCRRTDFMRGDVCLESSSLVIDL